MYVDLMDTEDVKMMFDEWQEWLAEEKRPSSSKLHVYIQNVGTKAPSDAPTTPNATQPASAFSKATSGKGPEGAPGPNRNSDTSSAGMFTSLRVHQSVVSAVSIWDALTQLPFVDVQSFTAFRSTMQAQR